MAPTTSSDVFITSSRRDMDAANKICKALEATGIRCWMAHRDIPPGRGYLGPILEALDQCQTVITIASANMSTSNIYLLDRAAGRGVPIVWLMLDTAAPPAEFTRFRELASAIDASFPPLESHLGYVADRVTLLLGRGPKGTVTPDALAEEPNLSDHSSKGISLDEPSPSHSQAAPASAGLPADTIDDAAIESALRTVAAVFSEMDGRRSRDAADKPASSAVPMKATPAQEQLPSLAEHPAVTPPTTRPTLHTGDGHTRRRFALVLAVLTLLASGAAAVFGRWIASFLMRLRSNSAH
jgi:hypothetical protein